MTSAESAQLMAYCKRCRTLFTGGMGSHLGHLCRGKEDGGLKEERVVLQYMLVLRVRALDAHDGTFAGDKLTKLAELMRRPFPGPDHVIYEGRVVPLRDFLNAILPTKPSPDDYVFREGDSRFGYRPLPDPKEAAERLACERCGEQVSESYAPGRCFNDQGEPAEMASHDVAAPWSEVHGTKT